MRGWVNGGWASPSELGVWVLESREGEDGDCWLTEGSCNS